MKASFAIGMCIQFITFVIYVFLYQHITNHNRNMFQYEVISKDTYRVIINYYIGVFLCLLCISSSKQVLLAPLANQNHIVIIKKGKHRSGIGDNPECVGACACFGSLPCRLVPATCVSVLWWCWWHLPVCGAGR